MRLASVLSALLIATSLHAQTHVPSFVNDVEPILTRLGCNQGACHGKGAGQNGFRLSLRGYAPEWDYGWITRENSTAAASTRHSRGEPAPAQAARPGAARRRRAPADGQPRIPGRCSTGSAAARRPQEGRCRPCAASKSCPAASVREGRRGTRSSTCGPSTATAQQKDVTWLTKFDSNDAGVADGDADRPGQDASVPARPRSAPCSRDRSPWRHGDLPASERR